MVRFSRSRIAGVSVVAALGLAVAFTSVSAPVAAQGAKPAAAVGSDLAAVLGHVRADGREFDDLVDDGVGVVAGEFVAAVGAGGGGRSGGAQVVRPWPCRRASWAGPVLTCGPSDDGGLDELAEFWPRRASSSASRAATVSRARM